MYLFSRMRHVKSATTRQGIAASLEAAGMASEITGLDVATWTTLASRDIGLIVWSATLESLSDLEGANTKLAAATEFGDWVEGHDNLFEGPPQDSLLQVIHGEPDPERTVNVAFVSNGVCANGKMAAAMAAGVEIAEAITKIAGMPTMFANTVTGHYGGVVWLGGNENLTEMDKSLAAINADPSFAALVDQHGPLFESAAEVSWYQRLG